MHRIELFPSGRRFAVATGQTLLDAALEAGIAVPYRCANGSCGECRARIVEGAHQETGHRDYVFTGTERHQPMLLMCRSRPVSDMILQAALVGGPGDIPHQCIATTVHKIEALGDDLRVITLRTPRSNTLRFLAGQQVELAIPGIGMRRKSLASCPCNGRDLQFHWRHRPGDAFCEHLFNRLAAGDLVEVQGPFGERVLDEASGRPVLLIAFDTGFAAAKSLIEHLISLETDQPMHLYRLLPDHAPAYLANQCRAWRDALSEFRYRELPGDAATATAAIRADLGDLASYDVYLSAPAALGETLRALLVQSGARPERIRA